MPLGLCSLSHFYLHGDHTNLIFPVLSYPSFSAGFYTSVRRYCGIIKMPICLWPMFPNPWNFLSDRRAFGSSQQASLEHTRVSLMKWLRVGVLESLRTGLIPRKTKGPYPSAASREERRQRRHRVIKSLKQWDSKSFWIGEREALGGGQTQKGHRSPSRSRSVPCLTHLFHLLISDLKPV